MKRRTRIILASALLVVVAAVVGVFIAVQHAVDALSGPTHRFPVLPGEAFLTDDRAAAIARDVMHRDGFTEPGWTMMRDDRSKAPDGRPDQYLCRNGENANGGSICFVLYEPKVRQRIVHIEWRSDEITAQGTLGK